MLFLNSMTQTRGSLIKPGKTGRFVTFGPSNLYGIPFHVLLTHVLSGDQIPEKYDDLVVKYLSGVQGNTREASVCILCICSASHLCTESHQDM